MIVKVVAASWDAWHTNIGMSISRTIYSDDITRMMKSSSAMDNEVSILLYTHTHIKKGSHFLESKCT